MVKRVLIFVVVIVLFSSNVFADTLEDEYVKQYEISDVNKAIDKLPGEVKDTLSEWGLNINDVNSDININNIFNSVMEYITSTISSPLSSCGVILIIIALCSLFSTLTSRERQYEVISYISAVLICSSLLLSITNLLSKFNSAISLCCGFNITLVPIYSGVLLASGNIKSLGLCNLLFVISQLIEVLITSIFSPMIGTYISLSISGSLNIGDDYFNISESIKKIIDWTLGIIVTLYTATLIVSGVIASVSDSITQRVGKYVVSSSIPIVGGAFSETFGIILGALSCLKSGVGLYAICALIVILLPAIIETLIWKFILLIMSHVAELFGQSISAKLLKVFSNSVGIMFSIIISSSIIFLFSLVVVVLGGRNI